MTPRTRLFRVLMAGSAMILLTAGVAHTASFSGAARTVAGSNLRGVLPGVYNALWLYNSVTLSALAMTFGYFALRPEAARWPTILLLGLMPLGAAALLYGFVGAFPPAHLMSLAAAFALGAAWTVSARDRPASKAAMEEPLPGASP